MIEISNTWVGGFEGAIRGCRNPYESHKKSDSVMANNIDSEYGCPFEDGCFHDDCDYCTHFCIGEADMTLVKKLIKAGPEHRKFLRMIHAQFDIRMPRYFAVQLDTYKVGTVKNSSSTMHLITKRHLTMKDFSYNYASFDFLDYAVDKINKMIDIYNETVAKITKDEILYAIKQMIPESFMQKATYDMTYETLLSIYHQRKSHRLQEWHAFCDWCLTLPYFKEFVE